jgi:peptidoglycan/xylan/chitin deacetylase (PgdA/CDA1 family)
MRSQIDAVLGSRPVTGLFTACSASRLRVLAYHTVPDPQSFDEQLEYLTAAFHPVTQSDVIAAVLREKDLPSRALWVTFDDGDPSVLENGLPALERHGMKATMFICPGVIDTSDAFWWHAFEDMPDRLRQLKSLPDAERRIAIREEAASPARRQLSSDELIRWTNAGHDLGNHTWDHPCLDRCDPDAQRGQVERAHNWFERELGFAPRVFAYPNGDYASTTEAVLEELGYAVGLLFDHRLARPHGNPLQMSRLRVDASGELRRFQAIVAGTHPAAMHALRWSA